MLKAILPAALLAAIALVVASPASAGLEVAPPPVSVVDQYESDRDGDGRAEDNTVVGAGGPCGCMCPVVGAGFDWSAAGQEGRVYAATVILPMCGFAVGSSTEQDNAVDPLGEVSVDPFTILVCYGLCDTAQDVLGSISTGT